jgi:hypothetical protein
VALSSLLSRAPTAVGCRLAASPARRHTKDGCTTSAGIMVYVVFLFVFYLSNAMSAVSFDLVIFVVSDSVGI